MSEYKSISKYKKVTDKTVGQCLRNNWNSINLANDEERALRIKLQNNYSQYKEFDIIFYMNCCWNEKAEEILNE